MQTNFQKKHVLLGMAFFLVGLPACQGRKTKKAPVKADHSSQVSMPMAANAQAKVHFFDEDLGEFENLENLETIVLDDSSDPIAPLNQKISFQDPVNQEKGVLTVYFDYDSTQVRDDQKETIAAAKRQINEWIKAGKKVVFKGHACEYGAHASDRNLPLSKQRASSLAERCLHAHSAVQTITVFGVGSEEPVAFEQGFEGQAPNRRVEIYTI